MTWRRRVLIACIILGCGVFAFQPLARRQFEFRLSKMFGTKVELGSSQLSLLNGTISLENIVVHPKPESTQATKIDGNPSSETNRVKITHALLRFDWNSVLFRNLKINNAVASGIDWSISDPSADAMPIASIPTELSFSDSSEESYHHKAGELVEAVVRPLQMQLTKESSKQEQSNSDISTNLKQIEERLNEIQPTDANVNPLRQQKSLATIKNELALLGQSIAENRTCKKEADKAILALKQTSQESLAKQIEETSKVTQSNDLDKAKRLAISEIAKQWNEIRGIAVTLKQTLNALHTEQSAECTPSRNSPTLESEAIITRWVSLSQAKSKGIIRLANRNDDLDFELFVKDLASDDRSTKLQPEARLNILNRENKSFPIMVCSASIEIIPQSANKQIEIAIDKHNPNLEPSRIKIQHAESGWISRIDVPLATCVANKQENTPSNLFVSAKLIGKNSVDWSGTSNVLIELDPSSLEALSDYLSKVGKQAQEKMKAAIAIRGNEQLNDKLYTISSRWTQITDEHSRQHSIWDEQISELNSRIQTIEAVFKRTSRNSGTQSR